MNPFGVRHLNRVAGWRSHPAGAGAIAKDRACIPARVEVRVPAPASQVKGRALARARELGEPPDGTAENSGAPSAS